MALCIQLADVGTGTGALARDLAPAFRAAVPTAEVLIRPERRFPDDRTVDVCFVGPQREAAVRSNAGGASGAQRDDTASRLAGEALEETLVNGGAVLIVLVDRRALPDGPIAALLDHPRARLHEWRSTSPMALSALVVAIWSARVAGLPDLHLARLELAPVSEPDRSAALDGEGVPLALLAATERVRLWGTIGQRSESLEVLVGPNAGLAEADVLRALRPWWPHDGVRITGPGADGRPGWLVDALGAAAALDRLGGTDELFHFDHGAAHGRRQRTATPRPGRPAWKIAVAAMALALLVAAASLITLWLGGSSTEDAVEPSTSAATAATTNDTVVTDASSPPATSPADAAAGAGPPGASAPPNVPTGTYRIGRFERFVAPTEAGGGLGESPGPVERVVLDGGCDDAGCLLRVTEGLSFLDGVNFSSVDGRRWSWTHELGDDDITESALAWAGLANAACRDDGEVVGSVTVSLDGDDPATAWVLLASYRFDGRDDEGTCVAVANINGSATVIDDAAAG